MVKKYKQPSPEFWWKCVHCGHEWPLINPYGSKNGTICRMKECPAVIDASLTPESSKIWQ